ncbi:AAA family ATPase [Streptomyces sp. NPDC005811]|uniref:AAA family ATPase n=1 Tax=Streptomyces sp. NPDC005811 TaxID=3154565 RepID=UPI0033E182A9
MDHATQALHDYAKLRGTSILSQELAAVVREMGPGRCVLLMGASGSGKSTLAARLAAATGAVVVSYDSHQRLTDKDTGTEPVGERALAAAVTELVFQLPPPNRESHRRASSAALHSSVRSLQPTRRPPLLRCGRVRGLGEPLGDGGGEGRGGEAVAEEAPAVHFRLLAEARAICLTR